MFIVESFLFPYYYFPLPLSFWWSLFVYWMQNKNYSFQPSCLCRVFCLPLPWAQSMSHLPVKGELTPVTQIWHLMWGPWYVHILWPGYHPKPALQSAGIAQLPSTQLPKSNKNHVLLLTNSVQTYAISQVSNCLTSDSRVQWLCTSSGCTLSMCITYMNCIYISWRGGLCPIHHQGTMRSVVINFSVPRGNDGKRLTVQEGPFSVKETHPRRTEMPEHKRGSPRHPWGSKQVCSCVN